MSAPVPIVVPTPDGGQISVSVAAQVLGAAYTPPPPPPAPPPVPVALGIYSLDSTDPATGIVTRNSYASVQASRTGVVPAIVHQFAPLILTRPQGGPWGDFIPGQLLDWANDAIAAGSFPLITWEWRDMGQPNQGVADTAFNNGAVLSGRWDGAAVAWLGKVKAWLAGDPARRLGLRLFHEGNGQWYSWSAGCNGNREYTYIGAWRHLAGLIRSTLGPQLAPRVPLIWTPGTRGTGWDALENNYPGSLNVDWLGFDLYNFETAQGGWQGFAQAARPFYDRICRLDPDKPIIVAETGCGESTAHDKAAWFAGLAADLPIMPRIRAIVEFDRMYAGGSPNYSVSLSPNPAVYLAWKALAADPLMQGRL